MKKHFLLFTLLLALMVPMAALAQVELTVTVYNGKDTECHVPLYGNVTRMDDLSYSQFIMDKSVLQAAGFPVVICLVFLRSYVYFQWLFLHPLPM